MMDKQPAWPGDEQQGVSAGPAAVLVVGAGPTGLTTAIELARRDVPVRVIDAAEAPSTDTRALGMQARTLELFERHGIVEQLMARGLRAHRFNVFSEGRQILRADFAGLPTAYPFLLMIPQNDTETVLAQTLTDHGVTVDRQVRLEALAQHSHGVEVTLRLADDTVEDAEFAWVVGADGAHSTVRRQLDLGFVGTSFEENFAVADLRVDWARPHEEFFAFLNRGRFVAFFPMLNGWHRVAIAQQSPTASGQRFVPLDELQSAIDSCVPDQPEIREVRQSGRFRINQRRAATHRLGRVFLAGDAAHVHSVVGAQGMNTGIQDAFNLGWKLPAVTHGTAHPRLLDTYAAEREPVADRLVKGTRRITRITLLRNPVTTGLRRTVAPHVLATTRAQTTLTRAISQLDVSYHDDHAAAPKERVQVGDRAPDAPIFGRPDGPTRLFGLLDDTAHTLLCFDMPTDAIRDVTHGYERSVKVAHLHGESAAGARYGLTGPGSVLVRPDGYIGYRTAGTDTHGFRDHLARTFSVDAAPSNRELPVHAAGCTPLSTEASSFRRSVCLPHS